MTHPDPTLELLDRFADEGKWATIRRSVPIFKVHERTAGGKVIKVTDADLHVIAEKANRLERESGVPLRLTVGHVRHDQPEHQQPPLAGYARTLRVGKFGPGQQTALLADLYLTADHYATAKDCPYRSAEYYATAKEVRGVALLKRDPQLDMGIVTYERPDGCLIYAMSEEPPMSTAVADKPAPTADPKPAPAPDDMLRMQRDEQMVINARLEEDNKALRERITNLEKSNERAKCEQLVIQLQAENYQLDRATEVDFLAAIPEDKRAARLEYIRKHYRKEHSLTAPIPYTRDGMVPVADNPNPGFSGPLTEEAAEPIIAYQRKHGCDWDEAASAVKAGKK